MKKTIRMILPIILAAAIIACIGWYLFIYDVGFTRDVLLHAARYCESHGKHSASAWFYNCAYMHADDSDAVAIELANQYKDSGNYTKAESTLSKAISDGGGVDLYIALCKTYVEQDKLMDAVNMLNNVTNKDVKAQLDMLRPAAPTCSPDPVTTGAYYTQYITVTVSAEGNKLFVSSDGEFPSVNEDKYQTGITLKDGKNVIYAVAVADNGLVSPAAIFGFTVGGVVEKVSFTDAVIESALREILEVDAEKVLYTNDLWTIKEFKVPAEAQDLSDLRHMAFLEKLTLTTGLSGQLSHISGLANLKELIITDTPVSAEELTTIGRLPALTRLTLRNCSLSTTAGLEAADALTHLDLSSNTIRNISPLASLSKLQELNLSHNALNDLNALAALKAITSLDVSYNNLTTLSPVTGLTTLKKLVAGKNTLTEINGFEKLTGLTEVDLSDNTIGSIAALASCAEITKLNVSNNALTDISQLSNLNKLTDLNFSNNKVAKLPQFSKDCALINIDGSYNQLDTLVPLGGLKKLNNVYMDYNKGISSVKALADCPMLIQVNVYGTKVTQVSSLTSMNVIVNYDPTK